MSYSETIQAIKDFNASNPTSEALEKYGKHMESLSKLYDKICDENEIAEGYLKDIDEFVVAPADRIFDTEATRLPGILREHRLQNSLRIIREYQAEALGHINAIIVLAKESKEVKESKAPEGKEEDDAEEGKEEDAEGKEEDDAEEGNDDVEEDYKPDTDFTKNDKYVLARHRYFYAVTDAMNESNLSTKEVKPLLEDYTTSCDLVDLIDDTIITIARASIRASDNDADLDRAKPVIRATTHSFKKSFIKLVSDIIDSLLEDECETLAMTAEIAREYAINSSDSESEDDSKEAESEDDKEAESEDDKEAESEDDKEAESEDDNKADKDKSKEAESEDDNKDDKDKSMPDK